MATEQILVDQPTLKPTRKLTAASSVSGLVSAIAGALFGLPFLEGSGEEVRAALDVVIDALVSGVVGFVVPLMSGWFVRDKAVVIESKDV